MPSRAQTRKECSTSSGEIAHGSEWRTTTRQHQMTGFATEKPLSSRAIRSLKLKEKVAKAEHSIYPPHSDLPLGFVKNADDLFVVQTKSCGSQHWDQKWKDTSKEEELVKYMSKVPSYLQRGEKLRDNVLNFGVLDWRRLEQWIHKHEKVVGSDTITKPASGSCSSSAGCSSGMEKNTAVAHSIEEPCISSCSNSIHKVDVSPNVKPLSEKALETIDVHTSVNSFIDEKKETCKNDTHRRRDVKIRCSKYKEKYLGHNNSNCHHEGLEKGRKKLNHSDGEVMKCAEVIEGLELDTRDQYCSGKQQGIVLLLPKDFSNSDSSKEHHRASLDEKSTKYNWGSFSDIFSIDEIQPEESTEIPHSCPLISAQELEKELDLKLDTLIRSQGVEIPENPSDMPLHNIETIESKDEVANSSSTIPKASMDRKVQHFSDEIHGNNSLHCRLSSGLAKLTRSLSFREISGQPPLSSTYVTTKSGPAKPEHCSSNCESQDSNKASISVREKVSPLRRLLDPIFKTKVADQLGERSDELIVKPAPIPINEEHEPVTIKALVYFTVKSGLPLFKFVVGKNDEVFASTVKSLSTLGKYDKSWLYTFYSVQKISKRRSSRKNHQKVKPSGLGYNVVGQLKVSEPRPPSWCEHNSKESHMVKESVLYNVEESKADGVTYEIKTSRELAAVVVNMPNAAGKSSSFYTKDNLNDCFSDSEHQKLGHIAVILPSGDHSLPHDGVPSSLVTRWRNGGSCDCGGWDIGCKLRILTEKWQQHKYLQVQCDLYDQESKQNTPFFSLIPLRDGLFSVEYDVQISSLQAFSISVALINSHNPTYSTDATDQVESKQELGSTKVSMTINSKCPENHAPHPPLSPVGRV